MGVKVAFLDDTLRSKTKGSEARAMIPKAAVRQDSGKSVVFVVSQHKLERRAVSLGAERGSDVEVIAGVMPGDLLVVRGPENLRDGQSVEVQQQGGTMVRVHGSGGSS